MVVDDDEDDDDDLDRFCTTVPTSDVGSSVSEAHAMSRATAANTARFATTIFFMMIRLRWVIASPVRALDDLVCNREATRRRQRPRRFFV